MQGFLAAHGLHGLQGFFAAHGLQGLFTTALGLQGLQGLQGLYAAAFWLGAPVEYEAQPDSAIVLPITITLLKTAALMTGLRKGGKRSWVSVLFDMVVLHCLTRIGVRTRPQSSCQLWRRIGVPSRNRRHFKE